jgi:hypothetical protein
MSARVRPEPWVSKYGNESENEVKRRPYAITQQERDLEVDARMASGGVDNPYKSCWERGGSLKE